MLVYTDTDILEIRPQQIIESLVELKYPYLKLIVPESKVIKDKRVKTKNKEIDNGKRR
tara:strand:- start:1807 stop:1980 length:174 start_codon:yes stop_codon:yes gene_type:complete